MQITFDVGYSRWVVDATGSELESLMALFSKAIKCHSAYQDAEERQGVLKVERSERLDISLKVNAQPLTLTDWIEPPKPDPAPIATKPTNVLKPAVLPRIRDFMDEQLESPVPEGEL